MATAEGVRCAGTSINTDAMLAKRVGATSIGIANRRLVRARAVMAQSGLGRRIRCRRRWLRGEFGRDLCDRPNEDRAD